MKKYIITFIILLVFLVNSSVSAKQLWEYGTFKERAEMAYSIGLVNSLEEYVGDIKTNLSLLNHMEAGRYGVYTACSQIYTDELVALNDSYYFIFNYARYTYGNDNWTDVAIPELFDNDVYRNIDYFCVNATCTPEVKLAKLDNFIFELGSLTVDVEIKKDTKGYYVDDMKRANKIWVTHVSEKCSGKETFLRYLENTEIDIRDPNVDIKDIDRSNI